MSGFYPNPPLEHKVKISNKPESKKKLWLLWVDLGYCC
jgi:hypothetical protein